MMGWDWGMGWGWIFFGGLMMVVFWGGLLALIVLAVRGFSGGGQSRQGDRPESNATPNPLEILKTRYAKGEITQEEFETIRKDLQS
jgi:putative membrane protein